MIAKHDREVFLDEFPDPLRFVANKIKPLNSIKSMLIIGSLL